MPERYALLIRPSANHVYADVAGRLGVAELAIVAEHAIRGRIGNIDETTIAGVGYLTFDGDALSARDAAHLGNLSFAYALFRRSGELFAPVRLEPLAVFGGDLMTIQKYSGKT